ncbi:MAG: hypothetical protein KDA71_09295 [Planctomycetales bacterium]|nr:hypothetical protein [Planctomycetales bacterium]
MIIYLGDGDDQLSVANSVFTPLIVHGGNGNDHLDAGGGPSVLIGDAGDDRLKGQGGASILIGGTGRDVLVAGNSGSVMIGGSTTIDLDDAALFNLLATWNSSISYADRVDAVAALFAALDDDAEDRLKGGAEPDLFHAGIGDDASAVKQNEVVVK